MHAPQLPLRPAPSPPSLSLPVQVLSSLGSKSTAELVNWAKTRLHPPLIPFARLAGWMDHLCDCAGHMAGMALTFWFRVGMAPPCLTSFPTPHPTTTAGSLRMSSNRHGARLPTRSSPSFPMCGGCVYTEAGHHETASREAHRTVKGAPGRRSTFLPMPGLGLPTDTHAVPTPHAGRPRLVARHAAGGREA